jgi:hypothetical protein
MIASDDRNVPDGPKRVIGLQSAEIAHIRKILQRKEKAFVVTKIGVKEEVCDELGELVVKESGSRVVDIDKVMSDHEVKSVSNWYRMIAQYGPPTLHMGPTAFFMNKATQLPIMFNTITDQIVGEAPPQAPGQAPAQALPQAPSQAPPKN